MRTLLLLGGDAPDEALLRRLLARADSVIAADSGAEALRAVGRAPDILVGDMDSIGRETLAWAVSRGARAVPLPREKDMTDGMAALDAAMGGGAREIYIAGALGGRPDMQLSNILLLARAAEGGARAYIAGGGVVMGVAARDAKIHAPAGAQLSILPLGDAYIAGTEGLTYPICEKAMLVTDPYAVSNTMAAANARVWGVRGKLLFIVFADFDKVEIIA